MKKLFLSTALLALTAGAALAADLPSRKAAPVLPPPPPPMWTGFYVGLNAGGTWGNNSVSSSGSGLFNNPWYTEQRLASDEPNVASSNTFLTGNLAALTADRILSTGSGGGFIGGGQVGYNWQFSNQETFGFGYGFVAGVEADIQGIAGGHSQGSSITAVTSPTFNGSLNSTFVPTTLSNFNTKVQYVGTVRGRLGFLAMPNLFIYGTGGLAYGGVNLNAGYATVDTGNPWTGFTLLDNRPFGSGSGLINYSGTQVGWTAGGGIEWMFMPNWSLKAEYLYYDLGTVQGSTVIAGTSNLIEGFNSPYSPIGYAYLAKASSRINGNIVRAGVNYHFNWGAAPVVAKY